MHSILYPRIMLNINTFNPNIILFVLLMYFTNQPPIKSPPQWFLTQKIWKWLSRTCAVWLKMPTEGVLGLLNLNLIRKMQNSKWRTCYQKTVKRSSAFGTSSVTIFWAEYFIIPPIPYPHIVIQGHIAFQTRRIPYWSSTLSQRRVCRIVYWYVRDTASG